MKRIASLFLLALLVGGLCATGAQATPSRGADCSKCHAFSNQPPTANAGPDQAVNAKATVTLNGSGSTDPDDGIASYAWTQSGTPKVTLSGAGSSSATFAAPDVTSKTVLTFQLTVKDKLSQSSTDTCTVTVNPVASTNQPPVANAGPDQNVNPGAAVTLNGAGSSDPDDGIASYAWTQSGSPKVTLSNAAVASPTFTAPQVTVATSLSFTLTVTDKSGASASDSVKVSIAPSNGPPAGGAPIADAGPDLVVLTGSLNSLEGSYSTDPDDGIASYAWEQTAGTSVILSDVSAADPIFQAPSTPATLSFQLVVTDKGGLQSSDTCTVVVVSPDGGSPTPSPPPAPSNKAPVAQAGKDKTVRSGKSVRLSGAKSKDPDGKIASYQWVQTSGPAVSLSGASSAKASFIAPQVDSQGASLSFQLTVTDAGGMTASDEVTINVTAPRNSGGGGGGGGGDDEDDDHGDDRGDD